eukprot:TRINITY_DN5006_c0_g2_i1.p1 TRINITY_DN5006_c0_g2~~TRINITY_DN5006_c0_g2_i1.p1  ORF type:complete len:176 (-),score=23.19 TRINITY_DN5006_c0_g2_i1:122-649(-)
MLCIFFLPILIRHECTAHALSQFILCFLLGRAFVVVNGKEILVRVERQKDKIQQKDITESRFLQTDDFNTDLLFSLETQIVLVFLELLAGKMSWARIGLFDLADLFVDFLDVQRMARHKGECVVVVSVEICMFEDGDDGNDCSKDVADVVVRGAELMGVLAVVLLVPWDSYGKAA